MKYIHRWVDILALALVATLANARWVDEQALVLVQRMATELRPKNATERHPSVPHGLASTGKTDKSVGSLLWAGNTRERLLDRFVGLSNRARAAVALVLRFEYDALHWQVDKPDISERRHANRTDREFAQHAAVAYVLDAANLERAASARQDSYMVFVGHVLSATTLVVMMCGDDVVWLVRFVAREDAKSYALLYILCMAFSFFLSWILFLIVRRLEVSQPDLPIEKITGILSTCLLLAMTTIFFFEWYHGDGEDDAIDGSDGEETAKTHVNGSLESATPMCVHSASASSASDRYVQKLKETPLHTMARVFAAAPPRNDKLVLWDNMPSRQASQDSQDEQKSSAKLDLSRNNGSGAPKEKNNAGKVLLSGRETRTAQNELSFTKLFCVALATNLDNISVYIPVLTLGVISPGALFVGVMLASVIITLIALGFSQCTLLTDALAQIPLWVIIGLVTCTVGSATLLTCVEEG